MTLFSYSLRSRPPSPERGVGGGDGNKKTFLLVSPSQQRTRGHTLICDQGQAFDAIITDQGVTPVTKTRFAG